MEILGTGAIAPVSSDTHGGQRAVLVVGRRQSQDLLGRIVMISQLASDWLDRDVVTPLERMMTAAALAPVTPDETR